TGPSTPWPDFLLPQFRTTLVALQRAANRGRGVAPPSSAAVRAPRGGSGHSRSSRESKRSPRQAEILCGGTHAAGRLECPFIPRSGAARIVLDCQLAGLVYRAFPLGVFPSPNGIHEVCQAANEEDRAVVG